MNFSVPLSVSRIRDTYLDIELRICVYFCALAPKHNSLVYTVHERQQGGHANPNHVAPNVEDRVEGARTISSGKSRETERRARNPTRNGQPVRSTLKNRAPIHDRLTVARLPAKQNEPTAFTIRVYQA